jgi:hypothetical protein
VTNITRLQLMDFSVFEDVMLEPAPGINVFLGTNATGKSHAMKAMYAPLKALEQRQTTIPYVIRLMEKLAHVFRPDERDSGRLVRRGSSRDEARVIIDGASGQLDFTIEPSTADKAPLVTTGAGWAQSPSTIFIPTREVLAMYEGFVGSYQARELSFDETYYDICVALGRGVLRGGRAVETSSLVEPIEMVLGGKVVLHGDRFYISRKDGNMEAHLVAEGLRKLASLVRLILNGSITPNSILFWDEPEANLNPKLVTLVVELLLALGKRGVQIFITTHDYLLSRRLSLLAEYKKCPDVPIRFFVFHRPVEEGPVLVDSGNTLADLPANPILDEFTRQYEMEREFFYGNEGSAA